MVSGQVDAVVEMYTGLHCGCPGVTRAAFVQLGVLSALSQLKALRSYSANFLASAGLARLVEQRLLKVAGQFGIELVEDPPPPEITEAVS